MSFDDNGDDGDGDDDDRDNDIDVCGDTCSDTRERRHAVHAVVRGGTHSPCTGLHYACASDV